MNWINSIIKPEDHYVNRFTDATVAHPSVLFEKKLINDYGNYSSKRLPEDFELWLRWMEKGVKFSKVPEKLLEWTDSPTRHSRVNSNYKTEKFLQVKANYFERWYAQANNKTEVWVWGYGHKVFKKAKFFTEAGIKIEGYVDVKSRPDASRNVISIANLRPEKHQCYLVLIGDRSGKKLIGDYFNIRNFNIGYDYFFMY